MGRSDEFCSLADLYLAYRKAKPEAFFERTHFNALAYADYEQHLHRNLKRLHATLNQTAGAWSSNAAFVGGFVYAPKSVDDSSGASGDPQLRAINPLEDWHNRFRHNRSRRWEADFRLIITPTVDFQIVSALWILKVGHLFDAKLDPVHAYANRVRRLNRPVSADRPSIRTINTDCLSLFPPYFSAYRSWRERGLAAMHRSLTEGKRIIAVTMDLRRFYHNVSPNFLTDARFHQALDLHLSDAELEFTRRFVSAIHAWYRQTPDYADRPEGAIPVGLSASKVISNVLLKEFDAAVISKLSPIHYGRYVDDVFLVLRHSAVADNASDVLRSIGSRLSPIAQFRRGKGGESALRLTLPYAEDSDLVFAGSKQKIFDLSGDYGLDLVEHISEQIRSQSSEHRLLAELPNSDVEMAARALLATPDATLEADALRKADAVSLRRLGFSLLLSDVEAYGRDLRPGAWRRLRLKFYSLVGRHLLTPRGFFEYTPYLHRVFGLMVASQDFSAANQFLEGFEEVANLLRRTTTAGTTARHKFTLCLKYYSRAFTDAALQASTVDKHNRWSDLRSAVQRIGRIGNLSSRKIGAASLRRMSDRLLLSDLGRRSYKEYWIFTQRENLVGPPVPINRSVQRLIRLGGVRKFRRYCQLPVPFWPALSFPTRALTIAEIGIVAPHVMADETRLRSAIMTLRGARVRSGEAIGLNGRDIGSRPVHFDVPDQSKRAQRIAVTSVQTTDSQWRAAVAGKADHSLARYQLLRSLVNRILSEHPRARYVVLPECSVPLRWAVGIAAALAHNRVSLLAGIEYYRDRRRPNLRNDCLISLTTTWPGYPTNVLRLQPKLSPSHGEADYLERKSRYPLYQPTGFDAVLPVYKHGSLFMGVLLCSDLTNLGNRSYFQGAVDALFVLEWNPDIGTFSFLIEATAHDVHAFVVQINNRIYGDSRIRAPYRDDHKRDLVRVKGGASDYYVLSAIEHVRLRAFQRDGFITGDEYFKPLPIGFEMSQQRKDADN